MAKGWERGSLCIVERGNLVQTDAKLAIFIPLSNRVLRELIGERVSTALEGFLCCFWKCV
jgi:hypothetical protein